jgi:proteasome assembly chaperone (PAC2) family protein
MSEPEHLDHPWLVAVWPGMGHVAVNAGIYLLSKLEMTLVAEYDAGDLFDVERVGVTKGIIQPQSLPRNRFFRWKDPAGKRDLVVFLGEAQPPLGKQRFCRKILEQAREMGVERVVTFAAMATPMHPEHCSRVFGAATDEQGLGELKRLELEILDDGHISGLNGLLLGVAAEMSLKGVCLLGEMPHIFSQLPFPKASQGILEVFCAMTGIELDFAELAEHARNVDEQLGQLLARIEQQYGAPTGSEEPRYHVEGAEPAEREGLSPEIRGHIEELFRQATSDRSKAFELKRELDRLGLFKDYEDRFLDLFKRSD